MCLSSHSIPQRSPLFSPSLSFSPPELHSLFVRTRVLGKWHFYALRLYGRITVSSPSVYCPGSGHFNYVKQRNGGFVILRTLLLGDWLIKWWKVSRCTLGKWAFLYIYDRFIFSARAVKSVTVSTSFSSIPGSRWLRLLSNRNIVYAHTTYCFCFFVFRNR